MTPRRRATGYLRTAMIGMALLLPALSLIPLGSLWLWQKGYLFTWVVAALVLSIGSYLFELWLVRKSAPPPGSAASALEGDPGWSPREADARKAVAALADGIDPGALNSREAVLDLGLRTVTTVARSIHPQDQDPLWKFTVPEALALVERIARDLRPFVADNIPLGDQLTIAQVIRIYRWRTLTDAATQAYDLWRIVRLLNPVAAITTEAREQLTRRLYSGLRDELTRRLTRAYVTEVGRAAIDLYGGRLRVTGEALAGYVSDATRRDQATPPIAEPLRVLVAGQISAGKSSLINALSREVRAAVDVLPATRGFTAYELKLDEEGPVLLIDSPGITADPAAVARLADEAGACDLLIWVVAANRADRQVDHAALEAVRAFFAAHPDRRQPPMLAVATHIDLLRPYQEWSPPYDVAKPATAKAANIRAALDQLSGDLGLAIEWIIPVCLAENRDTYNVELVWERIFDALPAAKSAQLLRRLRSAGGWTWGKLWSQAINAGKVATRTLTK